jgi:hypothetical protein
LESDSAILERSARILQTYQRSCSNPSIVAGDVPTARASGAPGPVPVNRANSLSLEQRAARFAGR